METAANCGSIEAKRDAAGRFLNRGGPGKPQGKTFRTRAREAMEAAESPESFAEITKLLWGIVRLGKDEKLRMEAAKLLVEWEGVAVAPRAELEIQTGPNLQEMAAAALDTWSRVNGIHLAELPAPGTGLVR
jgi:hypothetical protein